MIGWIFCVIAGAAMSIQGVMNTRLSDTTGLLAGNTFVQGTAFLLSAVIMLLCGQQTGLKELGSVNKGYLLGGVLGLVITLTVMVGIGKLSPTVAISTILIAQLCVAAMIDGFGWMGSEKVSFHLGQFIGLGLMIAGVIAFKWKS